MIITESYKGDHDRPHIKKKKKKKRKKKKKTPLVRSHRKEMCYTLYV